MRRVERSGCSHRRNSRKQHDDRPSSGKKWSLIGSGKKDRLTPEEWSTTAEDLRQKLDANPRYRLTIDWTIEEEPQ